MPPFCQVTVALLMVSLAATAQQTDPSSAVQHARSQLTSGATLRGMHDTIGGEQANGFHAVTTLCGRRPQLWSSDFGYSRHPNDSTGFRRQLISKAERLHREGVLITLSWHQCNPVMDEPCTFKPGLQAPLSADQWAELLTNDAPLNRRWKRQMDRLAGPLQQLQRKGVAVLLRPYHEANIPGFWWASEDAAHSKALWQQLRNYFIKDKALDNILWVWSVSYHPRYWDRVADYYPGDDAVDVIGLDIYPPTRDAAPPFEAAWATLTKLSPLKPIALSELSRLPSASELALRPWAYVVPWGQNMLLRDNPVRNICDFYGQ